MFVEGPFMRGPTNVMVIADKNIVKIEKLSRDGIRESQGVIWRGVVKAKTSIGERRF